MFAHYADIAADHGCAHAIESFEEFAHQFMTKAARGAVNIQSKDGRQVLHIVSRGDSMMNT